MNSIEATGELDGYDLVPVLAGAESSGRRSIVMEYMPRWFQWPARFAFDERFKLYSDGRVYDLKADLEERAPLTREALAALSDKEKARVELLRDELDRLPGKGTPEQLFSAGLDDEMRAWLEELVAPWLDHPADRPTISELMREARGQFGPLRGVSIAQQCRPPTEPTR